MQEPIANIQEIKNAASFLRGWFFDQKEESGFILRTIKEKGCEWYFPFHAFWGMRIRNLLRVNGYTEKVVGVRNLDDIYGVLVEFVILTMDRNLESYLTRTETVLEPNIRQAISDAEDFYRKHEI